MKELNVVIWVLQDRVGEVTGTELTGSKWTVSCVTGASADHTLVRAAVSSPPLVKWTTGANQWLVYPKDTWVDPTGATWDANTGGAFFIAWSFNQGPCTSAARRLAVAAVIFMF
jgi:hypothetical protein